METKELKEKATKIVGKTTRQLPYIIIMLFSIVLTGIAELVSLGWTWDTLTSAEFWGNILITNTSAFLMALSATLSTSDNIEQNKTEGLGLQASQLNEVVLLASANVKNDIDIFIMEENLKRKRIAYKLKIKRKIIRLEKSFKEIDIECYANYLQTNKKSKLTKKVKKRIKLEELVSEDYITTHIKYIKVRYAKVSRKMIENGSLKATKDDMLVNKGVVLLNGILPKFILSTSITIFIFSFTYDMREGITFAIIIPIVAKLVNLTYNYLYGRNFAPTYFNETIIGNLQIRKQWLTKYMEWTNERQKEKQSA